MKTNPKRGHLLMTKAIAKAMPKLYSTDGKAKSSPVIVKFFSPYSDWTWYVLEGEEQDDGDWLFFGLVDGFAKELGNFTLSELEGANRNGLPLVERDCYFGGETLGELV